MAPKSGNSQSRVSELPGSHPRARRIRAKDANATGDAGQVQEAPRAVVPDVQDASTKLRMSIRLAGAVQRIDQFNGNPGGVCFGCQVQPAVVQAETASGWLTLCNGCLNKARRAQVRFEETADSRIDLEREVQRRAAFARHGLLSGGGANGTGGRRR